MRRRGQSTRKRDTTTLGRDSNLARACQERDAPDSSGSSHRRIDSSESIAATRAALARGGPRSRAYQPRPRAARLEVVHLLPRTTPSLVRNKTQVVGRFSFFTFSARWRESSESRQNRGDNQSKSRVKRTISQLARDIFFLSFRVDTLLAAGKKDFARKEFSSWEKPREARPTGKRGRRVVRIKLARLRAMRSASTTRMITVGHIPDARASPRSAPPSPASPSASPPFSHGARDSRCAAF